MAATYEPIASTTLGSAATAIEFSGVASEWTDLRLVLVGTHDTGSASVRMRVGNSAIDSGSNYGRTVLAGDGTSATSGRNASVTFWNIGGVFTGDVTTIAVDLMSYANVSVYKTALIADAVPGSYVERHVGLWMSTSAIDIVRVFTSSGSFAAGTTASLYGIKAA